MKVLGTDFFYLEVNDLARSLAFYRDTLGLRPGDVWEDLWAELDLPPTTLALYAPQRMEQRPARVGGASVALAVADVAAAVEELRGQGVTIVREPMDTPVCHMAIVLDPDGNTLILHHRKDGTVG